MWSVLELMNEPSCVRAQGSSVPLLPFWPSFRLVLILFLACHRLVVDCLPVLTLAPLPQGMSFPGQGLDCNPAARLPVVFPWV
jgi:hypothetical protein